MQPIMEVLQQVVHNLGRLHPLLPELNLQDRCGTGAQARAAAPAGSQAQCRAPGAARAAAGIAPAWGAAAVAGVLAHEAGLHPRRAAETSEKCVRHHIAVCVLALRDHLWATITSVPRLFLPTLTMMTLLLGVVQFRAKSRGRLPHALDLQRVTGLGPRCRLCGAGTAGFVAAAHGGSTPGRHARPAARPAAVWQQSFRRRDLEGSLHGSAPGWGAVLLWHIGTSDSQSSHVCELQQ